AAAAECRLIVFGWLLVERLRDNSDAENRLARLVQHLHLPLGIFRELARNAARHVGADGGQLLPGSIAIGAFGALIGAARVAAILDAEEVKRHGRTNRCRWPP